MIINVNPVETHFSARSPKNRTLRDFRCILAPEGPPAKRARAKKPPDGSSRRLHMRSC